MPWKELCRMRNREAFVLKAVVPGANISALCREYGMNRKAAYKWVGRYRAEGFAGLEDRSRRPHSSKLAVSAEVICAVVAVRKAHPRWGCRKIAEVVRLENPDEKPPSPRTVHRILVRSGFLQPTRRRRRRPKNAPVKPPQLNVREPNDVWTVDFKGWWLAMDRTRCEPLTIRDARSRFVLEIAVLSSNRTELVREVFEQVFRKFGLPKAILTDNGPPFVASGSELGLTQLSAWWTSLGIQHLRTRPGKPADNGGHERMHRDMAAELEAFAALDQRTQQAACDRWRHDFNVHRPHEALGMKRPGDVYRRSEVVFDGKPVEMSYPDTFVVRRVSPRGHVHFRQRRAFISNALARYEVGLQALSDQRFCVWFGHVKIGEVDFSLPVARVSPARWTDQALSPMAA